MSRDVALTVCFSLLAAFLYALSNVLEQSEAESIPDEHALRPSLILRLARRRRWVVGFVSDAGGFFAGAAALAFGAVVFVEPIISLGLLMSLFLGSVLAHRRIRREDWIAAVVLCAGVSLFLAEVSPTGGRAVASMTRWELVAPVVVGVVAVCVIAARGSAPAPRSALLGVAAATAFAVGAVLTKSFVHFLDDGILGWAPHWETYAMAGALIVGFLLVQSAFQAGSLAAAVAGVEATEPIASVVFGVALLHEKVAVAGRGGVVIVAAAAVAVVWALVQLAHAEDHRQHAATPRVEEA